MLPIGSGVFGVPTRITRWKGIATLMMEQHLAQIKTLAQHYWPDAIVIGRKECNHEARIVNAKTGVVLLAAGSNAALYAKLHAVTRDGARALTRTGAVTDAGRTASLGLNVTEHPDAARKTELGKIERRMNELLREAEEWVDESPNGPEGLTVTIGNSLDGRRILRLTVHGHRPVGRVPVSGEVRRG